MRNFSKIIFIIFLCLTLTPFANFSLAQKNVIYEEGVNELIYQADSLFDSRDYNGAREIFKKVAELAEVKNNNSALTEAYSMIARTFLILDKKEIGRDYIIKAGKTAKIREPLGWSRYLGVRGRFEWQDNLLDKAAATFHEMYRYCSARRFYDRAIDAAHMMAIVSGKEDQVKWAKKGIAEAEAGNVIKWLGPLWNNLGATYEDMKFYDSSLTAYLKARDYHYLHGDETNKMIADWAVGHAYRLNNDLDNAQKWLLSVLDWANELENTEFIGWANHELGEIEFSRDNYQKAYDYLINAAKNLKAANMTQWDPDGYQMQLDKIKVVEQKLAAQKN